MLQNGEYPESALTWVHMDASIVESVGYEKDVSPDDGTLIRVQLAAPAGCVNMGKSLYLSVLSSALSRF